MVVVGLGYEWRAVVVGVLYRYIDIKRVETETDQ